MRRSRPCAPTRRHWAGRLRRVDFGDNLIQIACGIPLVVGSGWLTAWGSSPAGHHRPDRPSRCRGWCLGVHIHHGLGELGVVEVVVGTAGGEQFVVGALFDNATVVHDEQEVGVADGGEPRVSTELVASPHAR